MIDLAREAGDSRFNPINGCRPLRGLVSFVWWILGFRSLRSLHPRLYAVVRSADLSLSYTFADFLDLAGTPPTRYYARSDQAQLY